MNIDCSIVLALFSCFIEMMKFGFSYCQILNRNISRFPEMDESRGAFSVVTVHTFT